MPASQASSPLMMASLIASTSMAERLPPAEVVGRLNDLFAAVVRIVEAEGGLVNKSFNQPILKDHGDAYVGACTMK